LEEINRVGVVSGIDIWMGDENWRNVVVARLRSTVEADEASSVVAGMHGHSEAIDCLKSTRGSCSGDAIFEIVCAARRVILK
jgi:hypothetical protein